MLNIPYFYLNEIPLTHGLVINVPGALLAAGLATGSLVALRRARRAGLSARLLAGVLPWLFAALLIGGHIGEVLLYRPDAFLKNPAIIFNVWSGQACFGGFALCVVVWIAYFRHYFPQRDADDRITAIQWEYADCMARALPLGWFFGRLACFVIHSYPGVETRFWLGIRGICPARASDVACHDLSLYEAMFSLCVYGLFAVVDRAPRRPGFFIAWLAALYGVTRFLLDTLRPPDLDMRYLGLTPAQYGSIFLLGFGVWKLSRRSMQMAPQSTSAG